MTRHAFVTPHRAALAAGAALALTATSPAIAAAPAAGGATPSGDAVPTTVATSAVAKRFAANIRMSSERGSVLVGRVASYTGRVARAPRDLRVRLELRRDGRWRTVDRDVVARGGRFHLETKVRRTGDLLARVRVVGTSKVEGDSERVARVHGFRAAYASYYGPGLYGGPLACGGRLGPGTIGVAHKSLPCGTKLTLRVGHREVRARVIDRGPYVGNREFDLTTATRNALGFGDVGTVLVDR